MSRLLALTLVAAPLLFAAGAGSTSASAQSTAFQAKGAVSAEESDVSPKMLFDFEGTGKAQWRVESDRVMGGRSTGSAEVTEGTLVFTGKVVTEGGGFSSVRAGRQVDLAGYDGIELRVRGGGRTFELDVSDGTESRGREVNRRGPFPTAGSWETVRVPFDSLEETAHGQPVSVDPLDRSAVKSIGIYIIDGRDGPFRLEVDWIRAYREDP
jgi:NADH dehydrogenase [ubiquinone] 1 alpha subcomplex assembly factor 1